jgi:hypothetical protein
VVPAGSVTLSDCCSMRSKISSRLSVTSTLSTLLHLRSPSSHHF